MAINGAEPNFTGIRDSQRDFLRALFSLCGIYISITDITTAPAINQDLLHMEYIRFHGQDVGDSTWSTLKSGLRNNRFLIEERIGQGGRYFTINPRALREPDMVDILEPVLDEIRLLRKKRVYILLMLCFGVWDTLQQDPPMINSYQTEPQEVFIQEYFIPNLRILFRLRKSHWTNNTIEFPFENTGEFDVFITRDRFAKDYIDSFYEVLRNYET